jgi:glycosyltransferase involved in cell wall biosynthesis
MPAPLLLDLSHTCHTRARTGIQRVTRSLLAALGDRALPITHDPYRAGWRTLQLWERTNLAATAATGKRGAQWPLTARLSGRLRRATGGRSAVSDEIGAASSSGLIVPEVFSPAVARALPDIFAATTGPRIALFHDAIALQFPELTPSKTVARFPAYLVELLAFDGIAAVSEASRDALIGYWRWLGAPNPPPVRAIPLGVDGVVSAGSQLTAPNSQLSPALLCVGSIEGRKNHLALLEACERLWAGGEKFSLHLVGLAHPQTGAAALARIRALQAAGRALRYDGPVGEAELAAAYTACSFTVYPSLVEGFGLPVIESLAHGKPCICSAHGALGESATGGGCLALESVDASSLAAAIARLVRSPDELAALGAQACARRFKTWRNYADELMHWMSALPRP